MAAVNTKVTLRRLIYELSEWANAHKMVDRFGYGDFLQLYNDSENSYPYFMVNCSNATSDKWYIKYSLEICVMDWVYDERENHNRVESDTLEIIRDLQNTIEESPRWQSFSKIQGDIVHRKFIEKGGDKVTGWCGTLNLWIRKRSGYCNLEAIMPEYDFESGTVITPGCDPATILINGADFTEVSSGATEDIIVKDTDGNAVGSKVGNEWIVPAAGVVPIPGASIVWKTGNLASNNDGDDGDQRRGAGTDYFNMTEENPFGNLKAYTGTDGGYYDEVADDFKDKDGNVTTESLAFPNGIILCWKASDSDAKVVLGLDYNFVQSGTVTSMIQASPYTRDGKNDWHIGNEDEMNMFFQKIGNATLGGFNWKPLSFTIGSPGTLQRVYTGTTFGTNYIGFVSNAVRNQLTPANNGTIFLVRYYTYNELGL